MLLIPTLTSVNDGAFLADDTLLGSYELGGGWLRVERIKIGKRAFLGNSGMTAPGRKVPKQGLVAVLSAAPRRKQAKAGSSWLGSPPAQLRRAGRQRRRRAAPTHPPTAPAGRPRAGRAPAGGAGAGRRSLLCWASVVGAAGLADRAGWSGRGLLAGLVLIVAGAVAAGVTTVAKWLLVGRLRGREHPLWSWFVWRNELADTFVEVIAAPWFARAATGTPVLNVWLRSLGAQVGEGVWCETYWLPEADLVHLRDGVTVNAGLRGADPPVP